MKEWQRQYITWLAWVVTLVVSFIVASYVVGYGARLMTYVVPGFTFTTVTQLWMRVVVEIVTLAVVVLAARSLKLGRLTRQSVGITRSLTWLDIGLALAGLVVYAIVAMVALALAHLVPFFNPNQTQELGSTMLPSLERLAAFISLVICVPIIEEILFRGVLFGKLRQANMPFWPAALVVSVLFGVAHGQWNVGIDVFCLSMVASYLREMTGSIWAGVLLHMIKNAVAFTFVYVLAHIGG